MSKRKKSPVVCDQNDKLYIEVKAIMNPLCALIDGLTVVFFGKGKTMYMPINDAIEWCTKEKEFHSAEKYSKIIDVLQRAKREFVPTADSDRPA